MRMSMSKKIFAVVFMLIGVGIILVLLTMYSIDALLDQSGNLSRRGNRAISLCLMDRWILERQVCMNAIIRSSDEKEMRQLIDGQMKQLESHMEETLADYSANFRPDDAENMKTRTARIRSLWQEFVKITNAVSELASENSSN